MKEGWVCPICHTANSPDSIYCICKQVCFICKVPSDFYERLGYGTDYDGEYICNDCLNKAIVLLMHNNNASDKENDL